MNTAFSWQVLGEQLGLLKAYAVTATRAVAPDVFLSTAIPGRYRSRLLEGAPIGTRAGLVHVCPSVEVLNTMSLALQLWRNRQSDQATNTLPDPSTSAEGSPSPSRKFALKLA